MTPEEREAKGNIQLDEPTNVVNKEANLIRDPQKDDISMNGLKGNRVGNLQDLATLKNLVTVKHVQKERVNRCMGKPKGLLQI